MKSAEQVDFEKQLGRNLRDARLAFGATQAIIAECMDISRAQVANMETGRTSLTPWGIRQFVDAMGLDVADVWPK